MWWNLFYVCVMCLEIVIRYCITSSKKKKRLVGCLCALFAQSFWIIIFTKSQQYPLIGLTIIDFCVWMRGVFRNSK